MIHDFDLWSTSLLETNSFSDLQGATIGIEADSFLTDLQQDFGEALIPALGGLPFSYHRHINIRLDYLAKHDITPVFIFSGLDVGHKYTPFKASDDTTKLITEGWQLYHKNRGNDAVKKFADSGYAKPEQFHRLLQSVLNGRSIEFLVAPYDAAAELVWLLNSGQNYIDAVVGSPELLLYGADKIITKLVFPYDKEQEVQEADYSEGYFIFITQQACIEELGLLSHDQFVDAGMLSGASMLPPLPTMSRVPNKIRSIVDMMKRDGQTGISVCLNLQNEAPMKQENYLDRFRRSRLAVKHQVVLTTDGKVEPLIPQDVPNDLNELVGQRLPEELYYYLSIALLGPRPLNHLTHAHIFELVPSDGGESLEYQRLVRDKLTPIRIATFAQISPSLNRVYKYRDYELRCWFEPNVKNVLSIKDVSAPVQIVEQWNVHADQLPAAFKDFTLAFAVSRLRESTTVAETVSGKIGSNPINTAVEVKANTMWRFLHIREYVNEKHELTFWGQVLDSALSAGDGTAESQDAILLAIELLRHGLLNSSDMFQSYRGGPSNGSTTDRSNTLLVSRIASLLRLRHDPIGYVGPLSRHLLGYVSMTNAIRSTLRDLLEITMTTLLLRGDADRDVLLAGNVAPSESLTAVSLDLPLLLPGDASMGIAMKEYLDHKDLAGVPDEEVTEEAKKRTKQIAGGRGEECWFRSAVDFGGDLERAWGLWDAVYKGVKKAVEVEVVEKAIEKEWESVDKWLKVRR